MTKESENRIPLEDLLVFHRLARSLNSSFDLDAILRTILENMEQVVDAELWTLLTLDEERKELRCVLAAGDREGAPGDFHLKIGEGVAGWVAEHGETLIVPEASNDPRLQATRAVKPREIRSVIAIPLRGREGTEGAIEIFNPRAEQVTDYTIAFLHLLADHAAIAIENARDMARIQQLTITDDTTGLYNVRHLYDVLGRELERCVREAVPVSLAFLDLDRFKLVNDAHGHLVGSELLALTGRRIRELCRERDLCFRYGGDEFVVLMPDTDAEAATGCAEILQRKLTETQFRTKRGLRLTVNASIGLATAPMDGTTVHAILGIADARMYLVKGRTR